MPRQSMLLLTMLMLPLTLTSTGCDRLSASSASSTVKPVTQAELLGTWRFECKLSPETHSDQTYVVTPTMITLINKSYMGIAPCTDAAMVAETEWSYQVGGLYPANAALTMLDLKVKDFYLRPQLPMMVNWFNRNAYCGLTGWKLNERMKVTGLECKDPDSSQVKAGTMLYQALRLVPSVQGGSRLFMGRTIAPIDGSSPELRPTQLMDDRPFVKIAREKSL